MMAGQPADPGPSGSAPDLPDAAPDAVQTLLDGIWSFGGKMGQAFGEFVANLAEAIGGSVSIIAPDIMDAVVMLT